MIFIRLQELDYQAASAIASVILASLLLLFIINVLQLRFGRQLPAASWEGDDGGYLRL